MRVNRRQFLKYNLAASAVIGSAACTSTLPFQSRASGQLKSAFAEDFKIGTAIPTSTFVNNDRPKLNLIADEFNAITLENAMKWMNIHPQQGQWDFSIADKFVAYGQAHDMYTVGHTLVWHSQLAKDVFTNEQGGQVTAQQLRDRMAYHIGTQVDRYKGRCAAWDVVNEAVDEGKGWRKSDFYNILGEEYFTRAFHLAHEADPNLHLMYNDYNMHNPQKRAFLLQKLTKFKKQGVPIHGVGLQGHVGLDYPDLEQFEQSIASYIDAGFKVHITELDIDVLPKAWKYMGAEISTEFEYSEQLNPWVDGLPADVEEAFNRRCEELFTLFRRYREGIERVTFWGTSDSESWKNGFPVRGRTNYPLLFDRQWQAKSAYSRLVNLARK